MQGFYILYLLDLKVNLLIFRLKGNPHVIQKKEIIDLLFVLINLLCFFYLPIIFIHCERILINLFKNQISILQFRFKYSINEQNLFNTMKVSSTDVCIHMVNKPLYYMSFSFEFFSPFFFCIFLIFSGRQKWTKNKWLYVHLQLT